MIDLIDTIKSFRQPKGWKVKPLLERDPKWARHVEQMAEMQRQNPALRKRVALPRENMSYEEKQEFYASMQAKSTQEIIKKQKDPNYKRDWSEPLPDNVLANPEAKNLDQLVNLKPDRWSMDDIFHVEAIRRRPKNSEGQSELSGASEETKQRAAHHFQVTPPAPSPTNEQRITQLKSIKPYIPPSEEWRELTAWQAFKHWIFGGKVEQWQIPEHGWRWFGREK